MKWSDRLKAMQTDTIAAPEKQTMSLMGSVKRRQHPLLAPFGTSQLGHSSKFDAVKDVLFNRYEYQLVRVKSDPLLIAIFDDACEEQKAIMIDHGSTEKEAEAYVSDLGFLTEVLLSV